MYGVVYFFTQLLVLFLTVISVALLARVILSWFESEGASPISSLLVLITEPLILPVRRLWWFQGIPVDMPFLLTALLVGFLTTLLRALI